ncbi:hypothetical protein QRQ56_25860 [Bradyrhizobium sp. U531]|uniref:hypothetical protein n=1 Tax=Bradyrhizobium sp. U531 TaxID=3053458 RepID=UPI003F424A9C
MSEPNELQKSLIEEATYLRGKILTSYAQVEFLLADFSVKLDLRFPYRISDRIRAAKRICERPGYEIYRDELAQICDNLLAYDEMRNLMAHGFLMLTTDKKGQHKFDMMLYQREGEGKFNRLDVETNIERLRASADHIVEYVKRAVALFSKIYSEKKLEQ